MDVNFAIAVAILGVIAIFIGFCHIFTFIKWRQITSKQKTVSLEDVEEEEGDYDEEAATGEENFKMPKKD